MNETVRPKFQLNIIIFHVCFTYTYLKNGCRKERQIAIVERRLYDRKELWVWILMVNNQLSKLLNDASFI